MWIRACWRCQRWNDTLWQSVYAAAAAAVQHGALLLSEKRISETSLRANEILCVVVSNGMANPPWQLQMHRLSHSRIVVSQLQLMSAGYECAGWDAVARVLMPHSSVCLSLSLLLLLLLGLQSSKWMARTTTLCIGAHLYCLTKKVNNWSQVVAFMCTPALARDAGVH